MTGHERLGLIGFAVLAVTGFVTGLLLRREPDRLSVDTDYTCGIDVSSEWDDRGGLA